MDAKEFLKEAKRMCTSHESCGQCSLNGDMRCNIFSANPNELVDTVEKWSKEHPLTTNRMKFNEVFGMDIVIMDKGFRPMEVMPASKYIIDWLNAEYRTPKETKDD